MTTSSVVSRSVVLRSVVSSRVPRSLLYCVTLIPLSGWSVIAALFGRAEAAARTWSRVRTRVLAEPPPPATHRPGFAVVAGHALLSLLLGAAALVPLGVEFLFVERGVFYGLADPGPYDHSWGGPTRAGAWLVHFLVSVPLAAAGLLMLIGIAALHQRLTAGLTGRRPGLGPILASVLVAAVAVVFFVAWLHQI
jgi:hypothetical protein